MVLLKSFQIIYFLYCRWSFWWFYLFFNIFMGFKTIGCLGSEAKWSVCEMCVLILEKGSHCNSVFSDSYWPKMVLRWRYFWSYLIDSRPIHLLLMKYLEEYILVKLFEPFNDLMCHIKVQAGSRVTHLCWCRGLESIPVATWSRIKYERASSPYQLSGFIIVSPYLWAYSCSLFWRHHI